MRYKFANQNSLGTLLLGRYEEIHMHSLKVRKSNTSFHDVLRRELQKLAI